MIYSSIREWLNSITPCPPLRGAKASRECVWRKNENQKREKQLGAKATSFYFSLSGAK